MLSLSAISPIVYDALIAFILLIVPEDTDLEFLGVALSLRLSGSALLSMRFNFDSLIAPA